ncbi:hypothetical protein [Spiroplasma endosymbiont of Panorpa germanica]|uniref:hypothetical protein n=1 Tax=Spiroplasma endosymbiont of Panorpa germanica TaxID=3066314 RepID=UPI0030D3173C
MKIFNIIGVMAICSGPAFSLSNNLLAVENVREIKEELYEPNNKSDLFELQKYVLKNPETIINLQEGYETGKFSNNFKDLILTRIEEILINENQYQWSGVFIKNKDFFEFELIREENYKNKYSKNMKIRLIAKTGNSHFFEGTTMDFWFISNFLFVDELHPNSSVDVKQKTYANWSQKNHFDVSSSINYAIYYEDYAFDKKDFFRKYKTIQIRYSAKAVNKKGQNVLKNKNETIRNYRIREIEGLNWWDPVFEIANQKVAGSWQIISLIRPIVNNEGIFIECRTKGFVYAAGAPKKSVESSITIYGVKLLS